MTCLPPLASSLSPSALLHALPSLYNDEPSKPAPPHGHRHLNRSTRGLCGFEGMRGASDLHTSGCSHMVAREHVLGMSRKGVAERDEL